MKQLLTIALCIPILLNAQEEKGIQFEQGLSWHQILEKAKMENKFIFVDCYASWCGPCKEMDKSVYPSEKLGDFMNARFISVKVQFDSTKQDNEQVKSWYGDAHTIMQNYQISAFPSFLFFSPNGSIIHRDLGYKNDSDFTVLATNALTSDRQYYTLLENYRQGKKDYAVMDKLAETAKNLSDKNMANELANDYINNYLLTLKGNDLYTKDHITFIISFIGMVRSKDKFFPLFYPDGKKVDAVMQYDVSQQVVDYVISKEEIDPYTKLAINENGNPDWGKITNKITRKYGADYAMRNSLKAKLNWYRYITEKYNKDWDKYINYKIQIAEKYETDTSNIMQDMDHNNFAYEAIFFHSTEKKQINAGIKWMEEINKKHPLNGNGLDTYANLLYKAGKRQEAVAMEEKASRLDPQNDGIQKTLEKMKKGEEIWVKE